MPLIVVKLKPHLLCDWHWKWGSWPNQLSCTLKDQESDSSTC